MKKNCEIKNTKEVSLPTKIQDGVACGRLSMRYLIHSFVDQSFHLLENFISIKIQEVISYFQYCNGGDLADYLNGEFLKNPFEFADNFFLLSLEKGTLSEDTIRGFLKQLGEN